MSDIEQIKPHHESGGTNYEGGGTGGGMPPAPTSAEANGQKPPRDPRGAHQSKKPWWERLKPIVELATLFLVFAYTTFTLRLVHIAQRSSRPFVGVSQIPIEYQWQDERGNWKLGVGPENSPGRIGFQIIIRNFGPLPALNFSSDLQPYINGAPHSATGIPQKPGTLYPAEELHMGGVINAEIYSGIMKGSNVFTLNLSIAYDGPEGHYYDCTVDRFVPETNSFVPVGPCAR